MPRSNIPPQKREKPIETKRIPPGPAPPVPAQTSSTSFGSVFVDSMVSGFGFGMGSSLARSFFEPKKSVETQNPTVTVPAPIQPNLLTPDDIFKKYQECIERNEPTGNCETLLYENIKKVQAPENI